MTLSHTADMLLTRKGSLVPILLIIFMFLGAVPVGLYSLYHVLSPAPAPARYDASPPPAVSLALTAYWEEGDSQIPFLKIKGWVWRAGNAKEEEPDQVKLTFRRFRADFRQTFLVPVEHGKFETIYYINGFTAIDTREPIYILAESSQLNLKEEVYLNTRPPLFSSGIFFMLLFASLFLVVIFLWAFTGKSSPLKNRMAIIFSYIIIALFLALPLLAPFILPLAFPETLELMKRTPVGLIVAPVDLESGKAFQWVLNIGGHVKPSPQPNSDSIMEVEGGLVIPLYVIILSVIGGAINMTRQVPKFQEESETQENGLIGRVVGKFLSGPPADSPSPVGIHPSDSSTQNMQETSSNSGVSPLDPASKGQDDGQATPITWRTGLLNQYMFLVSAPFLAIATYYMLIGLGLMKVPVIVLMAFSVGLISEPILRTITDTAAGFLRQQSPSASPGVEAPAASK
jgi:hypothetical protein